jgi:hypothetical protein
MSSSPPALNSLSFLARLKKLRSTEPTEALNGPHRVFEVIPHPDEVVRENADGIVQAFPQLSNFWSVARQGFLFPSVVDGRGAGRSGWAGWRVLLSCRRRIPAERDPPGGRKRRALPQAANITTNSGVGANCSQYFLLESCVMCFAHLLCVIPPILRSFQLRWPLPCDPGTCEAPWHRRSPVGRRQLDDHVRPLDVLRPSLLNTCSKKLTVVPASRKSPTVRRSCI